MTVFTTAGGSPHPARSLAAVTLRPLQPDDAAGVYDLHRRLLPDSLYHRFQQYRVPTLEEVAAICALAPQQGEGFVAVTTNGRRQIVGMAYYVRESAELASAELAIVVDDRYQGLGIGRLLWQRLHQQAEASRLAELRVLFDAHNQRILRLIEGSGYHYECRRSTITAGDLNDYRVAFAGRQDPSRVRRFLTKVAPSLF